MPHQWVDLDDDPLARLLGAGEARTPAAALRRLSGTLLPGGDALFAFIGAEPMTTGVERWLRRDRHGFLVTGPDLTPGGDDRRWRSLDRAPLFLESSQPGLFVAGDVRYGSIKRVASAVGEGAMATALVHRYMSDDASGG